MGVITEDPRAVCPADQRDREAWLREILANAETCLEQVGADLAESAERLDAAHGRLLVASLDREARDMPPVAPPPRMSSAASVQADPRTDAADGEARSEAAVGMADSPAAADSGDPEPQAAVPSPAVARPRKPRSDSFPPGPTPLPRRPRKPRSPRAGLAAPVAAAAAKPPNAPTGHKLVRASLAGVLGLAGTLVVTDAVLTWVWKEPISAFSQGRAQGELRGDLDRLNAAVSAAAHEGADTASMPTAARPHAAAVAAAQALAARRRIAVATVLTRAKGGAPLGRLEIPALGLSQVIVQGTGPDDLSRGVGHYRDTVMPGLAGTVGIAGHRTTFGAPFRHVDQLRVGSTIRLRTPYGTYIYKVFGKRIVSPNDAWVLRRGGSEPRLVLTACHPPYSDAQRLVITARLARSPESA